MARNFKDRSLPQKLILCLKIKIWRTGKALFVLVHINQFSLSCLMCWSLKLPLQNPCINTNRVHRSCVIKSCSRVITRSNSRFLFLGYNVLCTFYMKFEVPTAVTMKVLCSGLWHYIVL
jgi:hypothetical protein